MGETVHQRSECVKEFDVGKNVLENDETFVLPYGTNNYKILGLFSIPSWCLRPHENEGNSWGIFRYAAHMYRFSTSKLSIFSVLIFLCVPLGTNVKNAVITVPAYFNDSQRQATKVSSGDLMSCDYQDTGNQGLHLI